MSYVHVHSAQHCSNYELVVGLYLCQAPPVDQPII